MGMIARAFGALFGSAARTAAIGQTVSQVAEVFRPNATRALELGHDAYLAAHASHTAEFQNPRPGWFDRAVNALNRLPRPLLALGTLALFGYAMVDPAGFSQRMAALALVPEPMWWLLGAVVAFYFGAREAHHIRLSKPAQVAPMPPPKADPQAASPQNAALADWRANG